MCDKREALAILNEVFNRCSEVIPVTDAYLYGSYARGDYDSESDVDIMRVRAARRCDLAQEAAEFPHRQRAVYRP